MRDHTLCIPFTSWIQAICCNSLDTGFNEKNVDVIFKPFCWIFMLIVLQFLVRVKMSLWRLSTLMMAWCCVHKWQAMITCTNDDQSSTKPDEVIWCISESISFSCHNLWVFLEKELLLKNYTGPTCSKSVFLMPITWSFNRMKTMTSHRIFYLFFPRLWELSWTCQSQFGDYSWHEKGSTQAVSQVFQMIRMCYPSMRRDKNLS